MFTSTHHTSNEWEDFSQQCRVLKIIFEIIYGLHCTACCDGNEINVNSDDKADTSRGQQLSRKRKRGKKLSKYALDVSQYHTAQDPSIVSSVS